MSAVTTALSGHEQKMIRLTYAHRWTALADALANHLSEVRSALGPLVPLTILVPHKLTGAYLKIALADRHGIAANLQLKYVRTFITDLYEASEERLLLTPTRLEHLLMSALTTIGDDPALGPVQQYLAHDVPETGGQTLVALRRAQLAATLTRVFDEYMQTRPQMLQRWLTEPVDETEETERWQAALWRRARAAARDDLPTLTTIAEAVDTSVPLPPALFLFDVLLSAPALQHMLANWAKVCRVEVYSTNPCMEFWEDLPAGGTYARTLRARLLPRTDGPWSDTTLDEDPIPLLLWGRPGRENVRQLNNLTNCDFDGRFDGADNPPTSILSHLQFDILHRAPPPETPLAPDQSVRIWACPGARREAEVIVESIWAQVADSANTDDPIGFGDIGIVLAGRDSEAYRSHFAAVFEEYHQLPHHFIDVPIARASRIIEAVELLMALPSSKFTRQDLLRILTHPAILGDDEDVTADEWVAWCRDVAIVHGADHADHEGTYIEEDRLNWDQGLTRLALGMFMAAEDEDGPVQFRASDERRYAPHEVASDRAQSAAQLITAARSLIADARFIGSAELSMAEWSDLLRILFTAYLRPKDDADERDLLRVLAGLEKLEDDDLTSTTFPFVIVQEILHEQLSDLTENIGQPLADGVVVAPLRLAAHLPLKVVYMPGLHEGAFPLPEQVSSLDVRRFDRKPSEIGPRERDQYQFLTRLLSTETQLNLSYVAKDAATGDDRACAPTLVELTRILEPYIGPDVEDRIVLTPPLRRYTDQPHRFASTAAHRESETHRLRAVVTETLPHSVDPTDLPRVLGPDRWARLATQLGLFSPPSMPSALPDTLSLRALRLFLEDPLQGWVHHTLGLHQDEVQDDLSVVDERFRTEPRHTYRLLRDVLLESLRTEEDVQTVYSLHADRLEMLGILPTGLFKRAERQRHMTVIDGWLRALRKVFANRPRPFDPIRFGRGAADRTAVRIAPALTLELGETQVELRGTTQPAIDEPPAAVILRAAARPAGGPPTHELGAFIDQAARSAAGETANRDFVVWTVYANGEAIRTRFAPFSQHDAALYLAELATDLRTQPHDYLLPFSAVHQAKRRSGSGLDGWATILSRVKAARFGPLAGIDAPTPSPEHAESILERRFAPFYNRRTEESL
ncbi:MAG: exodeoxyribonuclease V subunit gamma [Myxococcota bacterium]